MKLMATKVWALHRIDIQDAEMMEGCGEGVGGGGGRRGSILQHGL